jgi:outer membrane protein
MKMRWILLTVSALGLWTAAASAQMSGKIVTVDLNRLFNEYYKRPGSESKLRETGETFQKEFQQMTQDYTKRRDELNKLREEQDRPEYTAEKREQKRKELAEKLADLQKREREILEYQRTHRELMEQQSQRMRQTLVKEITDIIMKEARDSGYALVLDKSGNSLNMTPVLVYSQDALDITDSILKILNKDAPK